MRLIRVLPVTLVLGAGLALQAAAQVTGLPVHNSGVSTGLSLAGEIGFPNADYGKGTAYGARGALGLGPIGVSAVVSSWNPEGPSPSRTGVGGYLNLKVFGGPLIPLSVTLQGGGEYTKTNGAKIVHVPIGLGIALKIPNPALAIKPWIAPRFDLVRVTAPTVSSVTQKNFGISGGLDFSLLGGFGFGASYDRVFAGNSVNPSVFSAGINYTIKIPGL
ncbi:MAG TPA: hypothetical protein VEI47_05330 [Gemmatimonadales bacterium]|jgi:hypothetical protein|nr:hypothetical protein [Gemmatimonadales bacterium]